jgi:hypothetical protein
MNLRLLTFGRVLMLGAVAFVFIKIYQHNLIIKLRYEYQRLEKQKLLLEKERNDILAMLLRMQDYDELMTTAENRWGMRPLRVTQIKSLQRQPAVDFTHTTSTVPALLACGLFEVVYGHTGDKHARS